MRIVLSSMHLTEVGRLRKLLKKSSLRARGLHSETRRGRPLRFVLRLIFLALLGTFSNARHAPAVTVNFPDGPVQQKAGCRGDAADACDLRIYQIMVESFVDGAPTRNYNAGY